jgi:hypothetical protein
MLSKKRTPKKTVTWAEQLESSDEPSLPPPQDNAATPSGSVPPTESVEDYLLSSTQDIDDVPMDPDRGVAAKRNYSTAYDTAPGKRSRIDLEAAAIAAEREVRTALAAIAGRKKKRGRKSKKEKAEAEALRILQQRAEMLRDAADRAAASSPPGYRTPRPPSPSPITASDAAAAVSAVTDITPTTRRKGVKRKADRDDDDEDKGVGGKKKRLPRGVKRTAEEAILPELPAKRVKMIKPYSLW